MNKRITVWQKRPKNSSLRFLGKTVFVGGKKNFVAEKIGLPKRTKRIVSEREVRISARGRHGRHFDLIVFKGSHKVRLVIKIFWRGTLKEVGLTQTQAAEKEFKLFQKLKRKRFPVPPTMRLVEINGEKFVALTDISKIGNFLTPFISESESALWPKKQKRFEKFIAAEEKKGKKNWN